jgi:hypothetical protein
MKKIFIPIIVILVISNVFFALWSPFILKDLSLFNTDKPTMTAAEVCHYVQNELKSDTEISPDGKGWSSVLYDVKSAEYKSDGLWRVNVDAHFRSVVYGVEIQNVKYSQEKEFSEKYKSIINIKSQPSEP